MFWAFFLSIIVSMNLSYNEIEKKLIVAISEGKAVNLLEKINTGFTTKREQIGDYVLSPEMVSAYNLFYMPTNIPKFSFVMDQLPKEIKEELRTSHFIDLGTGPGTFVLAFLDYFKGEHEGRVVGVDTSRLMLEQAQKNINGYFPNSKEVIFSDSLPSLAPNEKKTLFWGHSLNEMGVESALDCVDRVRPETFFIIEPGTPDMFSKVIELREKMKERGYFGVYPCASLESSCPVQKRVESGELDWCHQVLRMTHEPSIERLSQLISKDRKVMPLIAHVYSKVEVSSVKKKARLIRFLKESKFSFDWEVCLLDQDSKELKVIKFEVLKKLMSKQKIKELKKESVGIEVHFEVVKKMSEEYYRVKLIEE